jgi:hydroxymethylpyrimidine pyrophosphatase-like HAD family hydrolase
VRRAADHYPELARALRPKVLYADLDGTLFGPGGSLFAAADGSVTGRPAEALAALHREGIALMPVSGRTVRQMRETARLLGTRDFIAELGGITCYDLEAEVIRAPGGSFARGGRPFEALGDSGAAGLLLEAFPGRIEPHAPWGFEDRETSMLFRGHVDLAEVRALLKRSGYGWVDVQDNGIVSRRFPGLETDEVHLYHLAPKGVDKASAVRADLIRRGLRGQDAVAVGDSAADAALAPLVAAVFIVANGRRALDGVPLSENVYVVEGAYGDGFAEAVMAIVGSPGS